MPMMSFKIKYGRGSLQRETALLAGPGFEIPDPPLMEDGESAWLMGVSAAVVIAAVLPPKADAMRLSMLSLSEVELAVDTSNSTSVEPDWSTKLFVNVDPCSSPSSLAAVVPMAREIGPEGLDLEVSFTSSREAPALHV